MMWLSPSEGRGPFPLALSVRPARQASLSACPWQFCWAWVLTRRRFLGHTLLDAFVHLPLVLPPVVVGYLLLVLFGHTRSDRFHGSSGYSAWSSFFTRNGAAALATRRDVVSVDGSRHASFSRECRPRDSKRRRAPWVPAPIDRFATVTPAPDAAGAYWAGAINPRFFSRIGENSGAGDNLRVETFPERRAPYPSRYIQLCKTPGGDTAAARPGGHLVRPRTEWPAVVRVVRTPGATACWGR